MPATNDDILAALNKLIESSNKMLEEQKNSRRQAQSARRANRMRWARSPRRQAMSGIRDIMSGRFRRGGRKLGKAWKGFRSTSMMGRAAGPMLVVSALMAMRSAITRTTDSLIAMNRQYEHASASMSVAMAQRDFKEFQRDLRKGEKIAGSANTLANAEQYRKNQHEQIDVLGARLQNYFMAGVNALVGRILEPINDLAESANEILDMIAEKLGKEKTDRTPASASEWANDIEDRMRQKIIDNQNMFERIARQGAAARGEWGRP